MRIAVHDFGGYSFPFQLSRELADRGHEVFHLYPPDLPGPKGLARRAGDSSIFTPYPIDLPRVFRKYSPARRLLAHRSYAASVTSAIRSLGCDVVLSANTPIDVQYRLMNDCTRNSVPLLHWIQDIYCLAVRTALTARFGPPGAILARPFLMLERRVAEGCAGVVCITPDFESFLDAHSIHPQRSWVVENWAPLDEVTPLPKRNSWSRRAGLDRDAVFLYSGTMGLKHNPALIYELARSLERVPGAQCVVISEGLGRSFLDRRPKIDALRLFDFQPYSSLSEVLAAADVLVAVIEPDASQFSAPSKVLSYLAAGRPVLLASPADNLAARTVRNAGAGIVVDPRDIAGFIRAAHELLEDSSLRARMSASARRYAEAHFRIGPIADAFENALCAVVGMPRAKACAV